MTDTIFAFTNTNNFQVVVDQDSSSFYTGYFDGQRDSWEILRARYDTQPVALESYFRTQQEVGNNDCLMECCEGAGHTYFKVEPRSFVVDGRDIFISWSGFYQNCSDEFASKRGLKWTLGVSKLVPSSDCILTGGINSVKFEDCTTPDTILFQGGVARQTMLGYSGIAVSLSPSGKRVFYLSVIENKTGVNGAGALVANSVRLIPEGEDFSKNPNAAQQFGQLHVNPAFLTNPVDDVGTIRLRLDDSGYPTAACRTAYDTGVFCYALHMESDGNLIVSDEKKYVTQEQIEESCTMNSAHYPITNRIPPVSTGLEVLWDANSPDNTPEMLFFGCYGEINGLGNFTTALADGTTHQTLHGGHPGTILFGPEVAPAPAPPTDIIPPSIYQSTGDVAKSNSGHGLASLGALAAALVLLATFASRPRKRSGGFTREYYEIINGDRYDLELSTEVGHASAYVEFSNKAEMP